MLMVASQKPQLGWEFEESPDLFQSEQGKLTSVSVLERCLAARDPDKYLIHRAEPGGVLAQPFLKGFQFFSKNVDRERVGGVNLDPVDNFRTQVRRMESDRVIPLSLIGIPGAKASLHIHAARDPRAMLATDPLPIRFTRCLESGLQGPTKVGGLLDGLREGQSPLVRREFATAIATTVFACPLNSLRPPHPSSPASSPSTSSSDMS